MCECVIGWKGKTCTEAQCHLQNECSGNGDCLSPGVCACKTGWGGPACNVDLCTVNRGCDVCTKQIGCGWCDDQQRCVAGSGYGSRNTQCRSWVYYGCQGAVVSFLDELTNSDEFSLLHCVRKNCQDYNIPRTQGPGSYKFCNKSATICAKYASCFDILGDKVSWNENNCRFGMMGVQHEELSQLGLSITKRGDFRL